MNRNAYIQKAPKLAQHKYEVTMSYHKADKHNNTADGNEDNVLAWAELEDNEVVIFTYIVSASTMTGAIAQAKQLDDTRKMEVAATWPSITQHMQDEHGEEITPKLLEDMYGFLVDKDQFKNWFDTEPTTISCLLLANKDMIHLDMENQFIEKSNNFISDIANWANNEEE